MNKVRRMRKRLPAGGKRGGSLAMPARFRKAETLATEIFQAEDRETFLTL